MLDNGQMNHDPTELDCVDAKSAEKSQYTLKGVERETIDLMRRAASSEGMKIGAWVSRRMREAAEKALLENDEPAARSGAAMAAADVELTELVNRIREIERELHRITSSQHVILTRLLENS